MLFVRARNPEALAARARFLREQARRRVGVLEARWKKRRLVLEKALAEFQRNLEHLRALEAEERYPRASWPRPCFGRSSGSGTWRRR